MPLRYRYFDQDHIEFVQEETRNGAWALMDVEIFWRDHFEMLKRRGYLLRPRFRPGWTPSWLGTNLDPFLCDDGQILPVRD